MLGKDIMIQREKMGDAGFQAGACGSLSTGWYGQDGNRLVPVGVGQSSQKQHQRENSFGYQIVIFYPVPVPLVFGRSETAFGAVRA